MVSDIKISVIFAIRIAILLDAGADTMVGWQAYYIRAGV